LGSIEVVSLAEAREWAHEARIAVARGIDPIDERRARHGKAEIDGAARVVTFRACAQDYVRAHSAGWSTKHGRELAVSLERWAFPHIGALPVGTVDVTAVMRVIEPLWLEKNVTARRLRMRIEAVLDFAKARGDRTGENPARMRGHLSNLLPKVKPPVEHRPALPWREIPAALARLRAEDGVAACVLQFVILTAARRSEARLAVWNEFDLDAKLWTVPAERMKAGKEHRVPLSDAAMAILRKMASIRHGAYVFPGAKGGAIYPTAMMDTLRRLGYPGISAHGFRSTFSDWAAEITAYPRELVEQALAHTVGSQVERSYRRGDVLQKRRELMEAWARFCADSQRSAIVPLRAS